LPPVADRGGKPETQPGEGNYEKNERHENRGYSMKSWSRVNRRRKKLPRCVACEKPIPRSQPDWVLQRLDTGERVFYHERCHAGAVAGALAVGMLEPGVWILTHRSIEAAAN
jgi:hypothetical protein